MAAALPRIDRAIDILELGPGRRYLDIGCGTGKFAHLLAARAALHEPPLCMDITPIVPPVDVVAWPEKLPFADASFDVITSFYLMRRFDDDAQAFQEVINGNAHAAIGSAPKPRFTMLEHPDILFMPTDENLIQFDEAFAIRKGDPDALNFFSNWILYNTSNGWLQETHDYWFKTQDWADRVATDQ